MFKLKCDDFLIYDEESGAYYMSDEQKVRDETERNRWKNTGWTVLKDWRLYIISFGSICPCTSLWVALRTL